ncbi:hypothetical protein AVEN_53863-1 [Araneus ventricosus]|uniref:Uncharacterized protein n=1 Tax=Araneus ventricosus TaxID=182803 RepID=A0A4Y2VPM4_ARAVE|nr:hypothetical protein AVEN_53863-1 [Araneus ventricosus]
MQNSSTVFPGLFRKPTKNLNSAARLRTEEEFPVPKPECLAMSPTFWRETSVNDRKVKGSGQRTQVQFWAVVVAYAMWVSDKPPAVRLVLTANKSQ